ncbi:hypothetical protein [Mucilaginibacter ginsenosidivorans]|uniref:Fumarate hydratase n=1 Tax=Mucilaginibacter ginsenosidivorans TaxID=398053 RepID=A0A5B8URH0_9SPHI|nr:hypothetical protein [Mucilaginibacter ginsenosidivorans]QEC61448.1 hypothetical protein FRZ54_02230 [Mucilaginibacter ginsenosidivorans]
MQKPFALLLLPFALIATLSFSCTPNADLQGKGESYLQGEWQQDSVPAQKKLVEYSLYHIKFSCDSFFMQINSFSKTNNGPDTCERSGHWVEYIKGGYFQIRDTLHVRGQFCNADHSLKPEGGCFRSGIYEELFKVKKEGDSLVEFSAASSLIPIRAHLIKRTTCTPKPL